MIMDLSALAYMRSAKDAPAYWNVGGLFIVLAAAKDTGGAYSILEQMMPKGPQAVVHLHETQDEGFYVLEGQVVFSIGDHKLAAGPGDFLSIPKNTWHSFESLTQGLRVLNFYAPAGFERVMIESGTPATSLTLPPDDLPSPDRRLVQRLLDEVGCRLKDYGGPLGGAAGAIRGGTLA
jgi:mannose-6-phosphate isomerase-like protein (cupin superfamily)